MCAGARQRERETPLARADLAWSLPMSMRTGNGGPPWVGCVGAFVLAAMTPALASAREGGFAVEDCGGCHAGGQEAEVSITVDDSTIEPGQTVRLSVSISSPSSNVGGLYLRTAAPVGTLKLVSGEPTKLAPGGGVIHTAPKPQSGGAVTFRVDWTAPLQPGDVEFLVAALAANGDRRSSGDARGSAYLSAVFGCSAMRFHPDYDGDGYGQTENVREACRKPPSYVQMVGDCDDYDGKRHPGASEVCNARDDDCDGQSDENLMVQTYCEDRDGDGHGVRGSTTMMGCGPARGFGLCDADCDDDDREVFPSASEQCNYVDDNCNGRVDEDARVACGEGWCRRYSESCSAAACVPGAPRAEECNALDDDCDGSVDEGANLCPVGQSCVEGTCARAAVMPSPGSSPAGMLAPLDGGRAEAGAPTSHPDSPSPGESGCSSGARGSPGVGIWSLAMLLWARRRRSR